MDGVKTIITLPGDLVTFLSQLLYEQNFVKDTFTSSASLDLRSVTGSAHNRIKRREYVSVRAVLTPVPHI
jgi:hypothetical protein